MCAYLPPLTCPEPGCGGAMTSDSFVPDADLPISLQKLLLEVVEAAFDFTEAVALTGELKERRPIR